MSIEDRPDRDAPPHHGAAAAGEPGPKGEAARKAALAATSYRGDYVATQPLPRPAHGLSLTTAAATPDSSDAHAQLAKANAGARQHSLAALAAWFPGYDFDAAAQQADDRRFTVLDIGTALFEHLQALESVESIVARQLLVANQLVFSHGDGLPDPRRAFEHVGQLNVRRLHVGPLIDTLETGYTTVLNGIDETEPRIALVNEHLERVYGCTVGTNVYISWGEAKGFGPHWDGHDTIIVPALGSKRWRIFEPAVLSPHRPWVGADVSDRPVWEDQVEPGMCLIIPRGWGHEVLGSDDLALHYTIGVKRISVADALERLTIEGGLNPLMRADTVYDPARAAGSYAASIHDGADVLAELVSEVATPELISRAIATYRARMRMRLFSGLFDAWVTTGLDDWSESVVRMPAPAGLQVAASTPDRVTFGLHDQTVEIAPCALDILVALADAQPHAIDELPLVNDNAKDRAAVCRELIRAGLLEVTTKHDPVLLTNCSSQSS